MTVAEHWIETPRGRLFCRDWAGKGVPMILMHDSLGSVDLWRGFPEALAQIERLSPAFADWNLDAALGGVRCPVLAIHGAEDNYGSPAHPRRLAEHAAGPVTLQMMTGEGHFPHRSDEAGVVAMVAEFLADVAAQDRMGTRC